MEEKERYVIRYDLDYNRCLIDTEKNQGVGDYIRIVKLLNQQDKRMKELEKTNKILSNELTKNSILKQDHIETCCGIPIFEIPKMKEENQQLKQQLHDLPKKIVREIRDVAGEYWDFFNICKECGTLTTEDFDEILDTILKKYGDKQ